MNAQPNRMPILVTCLVCKGKGCQICKGLGFFIPISGPRSVWVETVHT